MKQTKDITDFEIDPRGLVQAVIGVTVFLLAFIIMLPFIALFGMMTSVRDYFREVFEV